MDNDDTLEQQIQDWLEEGAAEARDADLTLAKLAHDKGWPPDRAVLHLICAAAQQVLQVKDPGNSWAPLYTANRALLYFAATIETVEPRFVPRCLEALLERETSLPPDVAEALDQAFAAADHTPRKLHS